MLTSLVRWVRSRQTVSRHLSFRKRSAQLCIETLEERAVPASVFLVPLTTPIDGAHFHTIADAQTAAGMFGSITIEPGAQPEASATITQNGVTIQGDPNIAGSTLLSFDALISANNVTLSNLRLGNVTITTNFNHAAVIHCLVQNITDPGGPTSGEFFIDQSMITGMIDLSGNSSGAATADTISNNTISGQGVTSLRLTNATDTQVINNHFIVPLNDTTDDVVIRSASVGVVVANNYFELAGGIANPVFMQVANTGGAGDQVAVTIRNNTFRGGGSAGIGLDLDVSSDPTHFIARVEGNDFNGLNIGVRIFGAGVTAGDNAQGNIDLGGGSTSLGTSLGGNNFRGFTALDVAILLQNTPNGAANLVLAENNLFPNGVSPSVFIRDSTHGTGGTGTILATALEMNRAYIQALYNDLLGRTGQISELDIWVDILISPTGGPSVVVNDILHSPESLGRIVDRLYLQYLGRPSDPGGRAGFISLLQNGATLENVEAMFVSSPEYLSHITSDYVQSLYVNLLGRTGSSTELAGWYGAIGQLGLNGVAMSFTHSFEHRVRFTRLLYRQFLHRTPADAEIIPIASSSLDLLGIEALILASNEFVNAG